MFHCRDVGIFAILRFAINISDAACASARTSPRIAVSGNSRPKIVCSFPPLPALAMTDGGNNRDFANRRIHLHFIGLGFTTVILAVLIGSVTAGCKCRTCDGERYRCRGHDKREPDDDYPVSDLTNHRMPQSL